MPSGGGKQHALIFPRLKMASIGTERLLVQWTGYTKAHPLLQVSLPSPQISQILSPSNKTRVFPWFDAKRWSTEHKKHTPIEFVRTSLESKILVLALARNRLLPRKLAPDYGHNASSCRHNVQPRSALILHINKRERGMRKNDSPVLATSLPYRHHCSGD